MLAVLVALVALITLVGRHSLLVALCTSVGIDHSALVTYCSSLVIPFRHQSEL